MPKYVAVISFIPIVYLEIVDAGIYQMNLWKLGRYLDTNCAYFKSLL